MLALATIALKRRTTHQKRYGHSLRILESSREIDQHLPTHQHTPPIVISDVQALSIPGASRAPRAVTGTGRGGTAAKSTLSLRCDSKGPFVLVSTALLAQDVRFVITERRRGVTTSPIVAAA